MWWTCRMYTRPSKSLNAFVNNFEVIRIAVILFPSHYGSSGIG